MAEKTKHWVEDVFPPKFTFDDYQKVPVYSPSLILILIVIVILLLEVKRNHYQYYSKSNLMAASK